MIEQNNQTIIMPQQQKGGKHSYSVQVEPLPEPTVWETMFSADFQWFWTLVFVPIVIAWITQRKIMKNKTKKKEEDDSK